jgi:purine-cytosine permease-like protein
VRSVAGDSAARIWAGVSVSPLQAWAGATSPVATTTHDAIAASCLFTVR